MGLAVGKLQDAEEHRAIAPERKLLVANVDLVLCEHQIQHFDEISVRDGPEGPSWFGRRQCPKLGTGDNIGVHVREKSAVQ